MHLCAIIVKKIVQNYNSFFYLLFLSFILQLYLYVFYDVS